MGDSFPHVGGKQHSPLCTLFSTFFEASQLKRSHEQVLVYLGVWPWHERPSFLLLLSVCTRFLLMLLLSVANLFAFFVDKLVNDASF